jgi:hypothetical protein
MASAALALKIKANHLRLCYYLVIYGKCHGEIRLAVEEAPSDELFPCPVCGKPSSYTLLGEGGTHRSLPFWDEIRDSVTAQRADRKLLAGPEGASDLRIGLKTSSDESPFPERKRPGP